jgi:hypothetical protein
MKNEEEPSHDSMRRLSRPGRTVTALCEKPRLGLLARIPEDSGTR